MLLPKDKGKHKIHRICIINTYELECNLVLKYFWSKLGMRKAVENKLLRSNQLRGRKELVK